MSTRGHTPRPVLSLALVALAACPVAAQSPPIVWAASYDGPGALHDHATRVMTRPEGVYVAGRTMSAGEGDDLAIIRYSRTGQLLWERSFGGDAHLNDRPGDTASHPDGGVVVVGYTVGATGTRATTLRYTSAGDLLWVRHHELLGFVAGEGPRVAVAPDGTVYVGATSSGNFLALAYDGAGTPLWDTRLDLSQGGADRPTAIALEEDGGVYLAGPIGDNHGGFSTVKLDAQGNHLWTHTDPVTAGLVQGPAYLEPAPGGGVVVSTVPTSTCGVAEARTWRLGPDGVPLWGVSFAPDPCDTIHTADIAVGEDGSVVLVARTLRAGQPGSSSYGTFKYDAEGRLLWYQYLDGGAGQSDFPAAIALDRAGNIYVTGWAYTSPSNRDAMTASYSPGGVLRWVDRFDAGSNFEAATDIALNARAEVFVTGFYSSPDGDVDFFTVRYGLRPRAADTSPP